MPDPTGGIEEATLRDLTSMRIECDELWAFCHAKAKNVPEEHRGEPGWGDVWTWTAIDPDTKLIPTWLVGQRNVADCNAFLLDLAGRLRYRVQLTTDGHVPYLRAVEEAFGAGIDYAMLVKFYGDDPHADRRFSPPVVLSEQARVIQGDPSPSFISTSIVERSNLTMRMGNRRFTRLTNAFSKKLANHTASVALHMMFYNFGRPHRSLGKLTTPAMAAGISDHVWTCEEIAGRLD